jgi:hypothetical protein
MRNKYLQRPAHPESITQFKLLFVPSQKIGGREEKRRKGKGERGKRRKKGRE